MRVEAYTQVQQIYSPKQTAAAKQKKAVHSDDQEEISSIGKDFQSVKQAVADASDITEDVTSPLKAKIQAGTYEVSAESFADKLMKKYEELR